MTHGQGIDQSFKRPCRTFGIHHLAFVAALLLCPRLFSSSPGWPSQRGGPAGEASLAWSPEQGQSIEEWHFQGRGSRKYEAGSTVWASPALAVVDGRPFAFVGGYDQAMHALDLLTRREAWFRLTNGPLEDAPVLGRVGPEPVLFFTSTDRTLYACRADTGKLLWTRELVPASSTLQRASLPSPLLLGNRLYAACFAFDRSLPRASQQAMLFCFDPATGRELWRLQIGEGEVTAPRGFQRGGRSWVYLAERKGRLSAWEVTGGLPRFAWEHQLPQEVLGSPALDQKRIFLGSKFGQLTCLDAFTGKLLWQQMAGNWLDNSAAASRVDGKDLVFVGSHDYHLYALRAEDGAVLWKRRLGGEVYSAPCVFDLQGVPAVAVACLDNHLYVLDALTGRVRSAYFTGAPVWDKVAKGENLWGSPVALEAGAETCLVAPAYSGTVFVLPQARECSLRAKASSSQSLWISLGLVALAFLGWMTIDSAKERGRTSNF